MTEPVWQSGDAPLTAWYGDDFTGAAAALEVIAFAGLPGVVYLSQPTPDQQSRFRDVAAIGLAGTARAETPEWMTRHLPAVWAWLDDTDAQFVNYKVCSTLDSAPHIGSIGRATELALDHFGQAAVPCLIAAPAMGRYQAFGSLFASGPDGSIHRLDRHPVMTRHPLTPMTEADVARHLAAQTRLPVRKITLTELSSTNPRTASPGIHCYDAVSKADMKRVGGLLWAHRTTSRFGIGSQGIQMALLAHWRDTGALPPSPPLPRVRPRQSLTISGSVSPTNAAQIEYALANGFQAVPLNASHLIRGTDVTKQIARKASERARDILANGAMPLLFTARGPDDPAVAQFNAVVDASGRTMAEATRQLGEAMGVILSTVLSATHLRRVLIAGGDTSGRIMQTLGGFAITALAPGRPGSSLFRLAADGPLDGIEIALKGGQMGAKDVFCSLSQINAPD